MARWFVLVSVRRQELEGRRRRVAIMITDGQGRKADVVEWKCVVNVSGQSRPMAHVPKFLRESSEG
jgi:hypothetical protein